MFLYSAVSSPSDQSKCFTCHRQAYLFIQTPTRPISKQFSHAEDHPVIYTHCLQPSTHLYSCVKRGYDHYQSYGPIKCSHYPKNVNKSLHAVSPTDITNVAREWSELILTSSLTTEGDEPGQGRPLVTHHG